MPRRFGLALTVIVAAFAGALLSAPVSADARRADTKAMWPASGCRAGTARVTTVLRDPARPTISFQDIQDVTLPMTTFVANFGPHIYPATFIVTATVDYTSGLPARSSPLTVIGLGDGPVPGPTSTPTPTVTPAPSQSPNCTKAAAVTTSFGSWSFTSSGQVLRDGVAWGGSVAGVLFKVVNPAVIPFVQRADGMYLQWNGGGWTSIPEPPCVTPTATATPPATPTSTPVSDLSQLLAALSTNHAAVLAKIDGSQSVLTAILTRLVPPPPPTPTFQCKLVTVGSYASGAQKLTCQALELGTGFAVGDVLAIQKKR